VSGSFPPLGPEHLDAIAALCRRGLTDAPSITDLNSSLFTPGFLVSVRGDPQRGIVASCVRDQVGYLRLLVVDPAARGQGLGGALLDAAEHDLAAAPTITVGGDAPDYLFPGVETNQLDMLCLLERRHYSRGEANFNMVVDLGRLPPTPEGEVLAVAAPHDRDEVAAWIQAHWPNWETEVLRCLERGTLMLGRDDDGIVSFCCWDGARTGWLGPVGVRPATIGGGRGRSVLIAALHRMRDQGRDRAEIGWVGPIPPYAQTVGAVINRVFFVYRKQQRPQS
jgi:GNAT superfamily N-acetyltransferase